MMAQNRARHHFANGRKVRPIGKVRKQQQRVHGVETDIEEHTETGLMLHRTRQAASHGILGKRDVPQGGT